MKKKTTAGRAAGMSIVLSHLIMAEKAYLSKICNKSENCPDCKLYKDEFDPCPFHKLRDVKIKVELLQADLEFDAELYEEKEAGK